MTSNVERKGGPNANSQKGRSGRAPLLSFLQRASSAPQPGRSNRGRSMIAYAGAIGRGCRPSRRTRSPSMVNFIQGGQLARLWGPWRSAEAAPSSNGRHLDALMPCVHSMPRFSTIHATSSNSQSPPTFLPIGPFFQDVVAKRTSSKICPNFICPLVRPPFAEQQTPISLFPFF